MAALQGPSGLLVAVLILQMSAALQWTSGSSDPFPFIKDFGLVFRRRSDACTICVVANTCLQIEEEKCKYYMETAALQQSDGFQGGAAVGGAALWADVDDMLYELADYVNQEHQYKECIPFVSRYTNCDKENLCLGCKTCDCDSTGHWNCSLVQQCRPDSMRINLDHRSLLVVLDTLRKEDINTNRVKREIETLSRSKSRDFTYSLLSEWIYGVPPIEGEPNIAKYTHSDQQITEPYVVENKYSDDQMIENSSEDVSSDINESTTEKLLKFILHDPLYENTETPGFDGNTNKVKRSPEYYDKNLDIINKNISTNAEAGNEDASWLQDGKFLFNELNNFKYANDGIHNKDATKEATDILVKKSPYIDERIHKNVSKEFTDTTQYYKIMNIANNGTTTTKYDMSEIKEFVSKVFRSENSNLTKLLANVDNEEKDLESEVIEKNKLVAVDDLIIQEFNPWLGVTEGNTPNNKINSKDKRSINIFTGNSNQINTKDGIGNKSMFNTIVSETSNNLKQLNEEDITEWLNDQHPVSINQTRENTTSTSDRTTTITTTTEDTTTLSRTEFVIVVQDLDEGILDNNKTNSRRKSPPDFIHVEKISNDYMYDDENVAFEDEFKEEEMYNYTGFEADIVNPMSTTESTTEYIITTTEAIETAVTEVVIDLLESAKNKLKAQGNKNGFVTANNQNELFNAEDPIENTNRIDGEEAILPSSASNIMKRDILNDVEITRTDETTPTVNLQPKQAPNVSDTIKDLIHDVLLPLNNILNDRQKELDELVKMKTGLVKFIKSSKSYDSALNLNMSNIQSNASHARNSYFSVYKLEIVPNLDLDYKNTNISILDRYMSKLKHDIYEVIRDIVGIQKLHSDPSKVPQDIKYLINAMKQYVHKKGVHIKENNKTETNMRRQMEPSDNDFDSSNIKNRIIKIIELLDEDMPNKNILNSLSPAARKILKRIIKTYYTDEFAIVGLRVHDPHYNLTNDLNNIGSKWGDMTKELYTGTPTSHLYKMKILYQVLNADIGKMADALSLIDFARTRRMMPIDEQAGEDIISRINNDLNQIYQQILRTGKLDREINELKKNTKYLMIPPRQRKKKESFIKQLKKMLLNSKRDIMSLLHKKVPKSEIVKELARKRLDSVTREKLSEYEDTMQRWQTQLNVAAFRGKRAANSNKENRERRMNNILPKYLRGKVPSLKDIANIAKPLRDTVREKAKPIRESKVMKTFRETAATTKNNKNQKFTNTRTKKSTGHINPPHKMQHYVVVDRKKGVTTQNHRKTLKEKKKLFNKNRENLEMKTNKLRLDKDTKTSEGSTNKLPTRF